MAFDWKTAKKVEDLVSTEELLQGKETIPEGTAVSASQGLTLSPRTRVEFGDQDAEIYSSDKGKEIPPLDKENGQSSQSMESTNPFSTSTDPIHADILDYLGNYEASKHHYNQLHGIDNSAPVTEMSINDLQDFQNNMEVSGDQSRAAGRYQFMPDTLDYLKKRMDLSGEEVMTPELQDRMAVELMKRRGLDKFLSNSMSLTDFANNLAKEWASLPVVSGKKKGKSYYANVSGNESHIPVNEYLDTLRQFKKTYQESMVTSNNEE